MAKYAWVAVAAIAVIAIGLTQMNTVRDILWPIEVSAVAQTVDGTLFLVSGATMLPITAGYKIDRDQVVRTGKDSGAILQLTDGSKIEMRERSELSLDRARDGVRVELDRGSVIVTAAKQRSGHLYVATDDCTVSVVGTVFSVNTGTKGSRVSVVEGEVHVEQGGSSKALFPGQQHSTSPVLGTVPIEQDIAWSLEADVHRELLRELLRLNQDLGARIASQELRFTSNLVNLVPENTVVLASLPNVTESFGQAYDTFRQRILENPVLATWWNQQAQNTDGITLDNLITRVRILGAHLGPEILIAVPNNPAGTDDNPVLLAEAANPSMLLTALPNFGISGLTIRVENGLFVVSPSAAQVDRVLALRRAGTASAFSATTLYGRVANAYREGVGWLVAADLERLFSGVTEPEFTHLGLSDAQQLLIEQKTGSVDTSFHATMGFNQPRRGMASWIAQPGPIGALEFVSPSAYGVAAVGTKDPAQIVDDILGFLGSVEPNAIQEMTEFQQEHRIDIRRDFAEPLGAEFLFAVDGPLLPNPSWKIVVEVYDAARLQNTIEWMIAEYNREASAKQQPTLNITAEAVDGRTFYTISAANLPQQIHYTFWSGYLVAAPSRTLVREALQYKETGNSLARSDAFRSQIPADGRDYVSGFFYQNVSSLIPNGVPLQGAVPTLVCLYGEPDRVVMSSKGVLAVNLASLAGMMEQVRMN